jgi:hypothetical protein
MPGIGMCNRLPLRTLLMTLRILIQYLLLLHPTTFKYVILMGLTLPRHIALARKARLNLPNGALTGR